MAIKNLKSIKTKNNTYIVADKVTLDGNVLNFWKSLTPPETEDTLVYSADLSEFKTTEYDFSYDVETGLFALLENGEVKTEATILSGGGISQISSGDVIYSEEMKASVEYLQNQKIAEMSTICNETIINGFDLVLSDGIKYHFSLTTQDQLNLITLSAEISAGAFAIPYHADDGLCKYYSASDMLKIIEMARNFKMYHTTYFNSLKAYIKSISNKEDIEKVWYGMTLDAEYQSDVLKEFMGQQI